MKIHFNKIHFLIRLFIFWMLFFAILRLAFVIYHHTKIPDHQHSETGLSFFYALRLDFSTTCFFIFIPYILWAFQQFYKNRLIHLINLFYTISLITIVSILTIFNLKMYGELAKLLDASDFVYLSYFKIMLAHISGWSIILLLATSFGFIYFGVKMYKKYVTNFSHPVENKKMKIAQLIIIPIFLFAGTFYSINKKSVNYSKAEINNQIATNNVWYLLHSFCFNENTN